jgi:hypothetical protein
MASPQEQQIETIFNSFDKDHSGSIELSELKEVAAALGEDLSEEQLQHIVRNLDANGDGKIQLEEFKFWWLNGLKGKLGDLVFHKAKSLKMTQQFLHKFEQAGIDLSSFDEEKSINITDFCFTCGTLVEEGA